MSAVWLVITSPNFPSIFSSPFGLVSSRLEMCTHISLGNFCIVHTTATHTSTPPLSPSLHPFFIFPCNCSVKLSNIRTGFHHFDGTYKCISRHSHIGTAGFCAVSSANENFIRYLFIGKFFILIKISSPARPLTAEQGLKV